MNMRFPQWLLAFVLALAAHMALATGFGGEEDALIESGPGDGGPLVIGSMVDSVSADLEAEEADEVTEADETEDIAAVDEDDTLPEIDPVAELQPAETVSPREEVQPVDVPQLVKNITETEAPPVVSEKMAEDIKPAEELAEAVPDELAEPVAGAVMPPLPQDMAEVEPETKPVDEPEKLTASPLQPREIAEVIPKAKPVEEIIKPVLKPIAVVKKKPVRKKKKPKKVKKTKKKAAKGARVDSRRSGRGGPGRGGGGGKGLGGRAMMSNYKGRVVAHLRRYKSYPRQARQRGITGLVRVKFTINASGRVISSRLVSGSGSPILDKGARATIRRANPFPSFPKGLGKSRMTFIVPIRFNSR